MAMDKSKKFAELTPLQEGEFWRIPHIAEKTAQKLHDAGIHTFADLARLSPDQVAAIVGGVGVKQKCLEFDWLGQALQFADQLKQAKPDSHPAEAPETAEQRSSSLLDEPSPSERRHLVSFVVELLLNNENQVQRTTVSLANRTARAFWSGWDPERLSSWIAEQAHLRVEPPALATAVIETPPAEVESPTENTSNEGVSYHETYSIHIGASSLATASVGGRAAAAASASIESQSLSAEEFDQLKLSPPEAPAADAVITSDETAQEAPPEPSAEPEIPQRGLSGELAVLAVDAYPREAQRPSRYYQMAQPLELRLTLDTSQLRAPGGAQLYYRADFFARKESGEGRLRRSLRLAQSQGPLPEGSLVQIIAPVAGLAEGAYRLETNVVVYLESAAHPDREGLRAFSEGGRLQVFAERVP